MAPVFVKDTELESYKQELFKKITENNYEEIEGSKIFAKCFINAIKSFEETIEDKKSKGVFMRIIGMLYKGWINFCELSRTNFKELKNTVEKLQEEIRQNTKNEAINKEQYEKNIQALITKYESRSNVNKYIEMKKQFSEYALKLAKEKHELESKVEKISAVNSQISEEYKKLQESSDRALMAGKIRGLEEELYHTQDILRKEREAKMTLGFKLYALTDATKIEAAAKDQIIIQKTAEYDKLFMQHTDLKSQLETERNRLKDANEKNKHHEEEIRNLKIKCDDFKQMIRTKENTIGNLKDTIEDLQTQIKLLREGFLLREELTIEATLDMMVNNELCGKINNNLKAISTNVQGNYSFEKGREQPKAVCDYDSNVGEYKLTSLNLQKFTYSKPSYRSLISELLPTESTKVSYVPPYPTWVNVTIRAIFDSYTAEAIFSYGKSANLIQFPEFVYSWLGNFTVDSSTHRVRQIAYSERETGVPTARLNLYLCLELSASKKFWELQVFKEFLDEICAVDELIFFLHARRILFSGPQLNHPAAISCPIHFISRDSAFEALEKILYQFKPDQRTLLKEKLVEYAKSVHKDGMALDSVMVLRVLLEYYRKQKKENIAKFSEIYKSVKSTKEILDENATFEDFKNMMLTLFDPEINQIDLVKLYRDSYVAGGSKSNINSILTIFNESHFY